MESSANSAIILSLMSGTSVDTIDAAVCQVTINGSGRFSCEVLTFVEHPMNENLRGKIFTAFENGNNSLSLCCSLNFEIGEAFAEAANIAIEQWGEQREAIRAIASHGQTLYHIAPHMVSNGSADYMASTLQVGEAAVIADRTHLPVISNFRVADMAAGGNGAPLVPFADYHLFGEPDRGVVVHNLGGIANCTWLPPSGIPGDVLAFDTGPANMIIDALTNYFYPGEEFDRDGAHGAAGQVLPEVLREWMKIPYITAPPPKSTGRELFGKQFVEAVIAHCGKQKADDLIATATEFTAASLAENLRLYVQPKGTIDSLYLAGGGARNGYLVARIQDLLKHDISNIQILESHRSGVTSKNRECVGFAIMGFAHLLGVPSNLPSVTGARRPVILGDYTPVP